MSEADPDGLFAHQRISAVFAQLPVTLLVTVLNSLLLAMVMRPVMDASFLITWCALNIALSATRMFAWRVYRSAQHDQQVRMLSRWTAVATMGSLAAGTLWGVGAAVMFPEQAPYLMFLALVIGGMCAGAATVNASHLPTAVAFILPATLPLAVRLLIDGGRLQTALAILCVVFAGALCLVSSRFQHWFLATLTAQRALKDANIRLQAEMATRRKAEEDLLHAQKLEAIGRLTAGVAHDFNNLLMTIGMAAESGSRREKPGSEQLAIFETIGQAVGRGKALTQRLLAFGRKQALRPSRVDLNELIANLRPILATTVGDQVTIVVTPAAELPAVLVDVEQIENAILNLVINARDALPGSGFIEITTNALVSAGTKGGDPPPGNYVVISVSDNGAGMPEAVRTQAFEPFFTTKDKGRGSGLGLSQVYGLVRQSGGTATIESEPGLGTTVRLFLPAIKGDVDQAA